MKLISSRPDGNYLLIRRNVHRSLTYVDLYVNHNNNKSPVRLCLITSIDNIEIAQRKG